MPSPAEKVALASVLVCLGAFVPGAIGMARGAIEPTLVASESVVLTAATPSATVETTPFGRHGELTAAEREMAEIAWSYFVRTTQPETGLANAVGEYASTTMWDTASYLSGLVSAYELGIIERREFDSRTSKALAALRNLDLFRGQLPNKAYNTKTGEKVDYANKPGELGYSALDIGRLLVWLKIIKERYPHHAGSADNIVLRWSFCDILTDEGHLQGATIGKDDKLRLLQEGRLGYEEYSAKGFQLWGFDTTAASRAEPFQMINIMGVDVPADGRDPRIFKNQNYVVSEGYILEGLELNWDLADDRTNTPHVASDGWRADFADRIYQVQERRFEETGIMTARTEHQVEGQPYFVYDAIFADGYAWNTLDPTQAEQPDRAAVSTKAAVAMWALWDTDYSQLLFDHVASYGEMGLGLDEGVYENGSGVIPLQTANNNGIVLAALLYKAQGPILQFNNDLPQIWERAHAGTGLRETRCHPDFTPLPPAAPILSSDALCPEGVTVPALPGQAYCRPPRPNRSASLIELSNLELPK